MLIWGARGRRTADLKGLDQHAREPERHALWILIAVHCDHKHPFSASGRQKKTVVCSTKGRAENKCRCNLTRRRRESTDGICFLLCPCESTKQPSSFQLLLQNLLATSKQSPKSMWTILPELRCSMRLDG